MIAGFAASAILAVLFVWREARAAQPMLPLVAVQASDVCADVAGRACWSTSPFYGLIFVLSLYFQRVNGLSPFVTGLAFVPMMGAVLPVNLLAPRLAERIGAPRPSPPVRALSAVGCLALLGSQPARATGRSARRLIAIERRSRLAGAAADLDVARKRRQVALRHRRRRAQCDTADRQRARRRAVRLAGRQSITALHGGPARSRWSYRSGIRRRCCVRLSRRRAASVTKAENVQAIRANPEPYDISAGSKHCSPSAKPAHGRLT